MKRKFIVALIVSFLLSISAGAARAQTSSFVFQGKLNDGGLPANGNYEFVIRLYDAPVGGSEIGSTIAGLPATVTNGIFSLNLDFGAFGFDGSARYLEIGVRPAGTNTYILLNPRQQVMSTPYAVKSLSAVSATTAVTATTAGNALNLGGVPAAQYVVTADGRLSDARQPLPNSAFYIQNTANQQASANFNIAGEGKAASFNAAGYKINNNRVFHLTGTDNVFVGLESGGAITSGNTNAFFGAFSGKGTTTGFNNAFFGSYAGRDNTTGINNAFFGANAGLSNNGNFNAFFGSGAGLTNGGGSNNSYFGSAAGQTNLTGDDNSFFGSSAGKSVANTSFNAFFGAFSGEKTTSGAGNTFVGTFAGRENTIGFNNTFVGYKAGQTPTTGSGNVALGYNASVASGVSNSVAIGANVTVATSNTIQIGKSGDWTKLSQIDADDIYVFQINAVNGVFSGDVTADNLKATSDGTSLKATTVTDLQANNVDIDQQLTAQKFRFLSFSSFPGNPPKPLCYTQQASNLSVYYMAQCPSNLAPAANEALAKTVGAQQEQIKNLREEVEQLKTLVCAQQPAAAVCRPKTAAADKNKETEESNK